MVNAVGFLSRDGGDYRFPDYNYLDVQNVNYDPSKATSFSDNPKTIIVPIDVLEKVDDSTPVDFQTGLNFGQNPQPTSGSSVILENPVDVVPVKELAPMSMNETILEEDASFVLAKDFQYVSGYGNMVCPAYEACPQVMVAKYSTLKAGTKVTGRLIRRVTLVAYRLPAGTPTPPPTSEEFLAVKGYGEQGSIDIPLEYLIRDDQNVIRLKNDNQKTLLIIGIVVAGYLLFTKRE